MTCGSWTGAARHRPGRPGYHWTSATRRVCAARSRVRPLCTISPPSSRGPAGWGVRSVVRAALATGVPRLVHCSSIHAFDIEARAGEPVDEEGPRSRRADLPAYDRSKAAGEVEVQRAVDSGLNAVIVNPTGVIGP